MATNAVLIFDVEPNENSSIVRQMAMLGYNNQWSSNNVRYQLPSNTVWKPNTELQTAINDLNNSIAAINSGRAIGQIRLIRYLALNSTPWIATPIIPTAP